MHTQKTSLNYTTPELILIRAGRDYKSGKALPHNTTAFSRLELEISSLARRDPNHLKYMFSSKLFYSLRYIMEFP